VGQKERYPKVWKIAKGRTHGRPQERSSRALSPRPRSALQRIRHACPCCCSCCCCRVRVLVCWVLAVPAACPGRATGGCQTLAESRVEEEAQRAAPRWSAPRRRGQRHGCGWELPGHTALALALALHQCTQVGLCGVQLLGQEQGALFWGWGWDPRVRAQALCCFLRSSSGGAARGPCPRKTARRKGSQHSCMPRRQSHGSASS